MNHTSSETTIFEQAPAVLEDFHNIRQIREELHHKTSETMDLEQAVAGTEMA